jgi:hypothetical protein
MVQKMLNLSLSFFIQVNYGHFSLHVLYTIRQIFKI